MSENVKFEMVLKSAAGLPDVTEKTEAEAIEVDCVEVVDAD